MQGIARNSIFIDRMIFVRQVTTGSVRTSARGSTHSNIVQCQLDGMLGHA